jgi:hypothetical protein
MASVQPLFAAFARCPDAGSHRVTHRSSLGSVTEEEDSQALEEHGDTPAEAEADLFRSLWTDAVAQLGYADRSKGQERDRFRRAFVRAAMSLLEAQIWQWKETALLEDDSNSTLDPRGPALPEMDRACLRNLEYRVTDRGQARATSRSWGVVPELKYTLRCVAAVRETMEYARLADGLDFAVFQRAVDIRNRITHPKTASDLHVEDSDVADVKGALELLHSAFNQLSPIEIRYSDGSKSTDPLDWERMVTVVLGERPESD